MLDALSTPKNRVVTFILIAVCCAAAIGAGLVGIDDNPPGILLAFLAATALILAFVHPWRSARQFGIFLAASILALVICGILHNLFEALATKPGAEGILQIAMQGISVAAFLIAVLLCPPAILVGAVGAIVMLAMGGRRTRQTHVGDA